MAFSTATTAAALFGSLPDTTVPATDVDHFHTPRLMPWTTVYSMSRYVMALRTQRSSWRQNAPSGHRQTAVLSAVGRICCAGRCGGTPWQNAYAERLIGSIRRECLDHIVVFGERHLRHVLLSYMDYYNGARTHLSLNKDAPISRAAEAAGRILSRPILGGLHHQYARA